ncbi:lysine--tRNA ligase [bacterium]|jgi:lysyl-tRNA synthetase class 2|nr:lysine--tRNA ligase [bacterium]MDP6571798.1 lysine--tRNA ligase [Patescibacteria group bacterium]MDP6756187.1 lysine--tRNA ligase [Patescibacteria group bacterium]|tara:strand:- start:25498 stop:26985 length:1488 start_codon:yes stop_codon:yes gene_type:complete
MAKKETYQDESLTRAQRLEALIKKGINPYPSQSDRTHTIIDLEDNLNKLKKSKKIILVGRVRSIRAHGGSSFAHIEDGTGRFQVYFKKDELKKDLYKNFIELIDVGDFIQVTGSLFKTKKGEHTIMVNDWTLLSKTLSPMPEKWHGLQDIEARFRKRYLDLITNEEVREIFYARAAIVSTIRMFLNEHGFLEVDTPELQPMPGGALAKPFVTHHNSLDTDLYLRIAPELYLKRLIVGGYERVYEVARCFRNEGMDWSHNPEFTQVEFYAAYMDYEQLMDLTEDLILEIVKNVNDSNEIEYEGNKIKFKKKFKRVQFRQALIDAADIDIEAYPDQKSIYKKAQKLGLKDIKPKDSRGKICDELYKEFVRPNLVQPTFMIDHPVELSPLAKKKEDDPRYVERFQLVVGGGIELVNAFSELNDPIDQRERFNEQQEAAIAGDEEAHPIDDDFIEALEHGMPPTAGFGMGIDRLTSLLTNKKNIKEVILFPTLRPKDKS